MYVYTKCEPAQRTEEDSEALRTTIVGKYKLSNMEINLGILEDQQVFLTTETILQTHLYMCVRACVRTCTSAHANVCGCACVCMCVCSFILF